MKVLKLKEDPVYSANVEIILSNPDEFQEYIWHKYQIRVKPVTTADGRTDYVDNIKSGERHHYIWLRRWDNNTYTYSVIGHEVYHLMCNIFMHRGIMLDTDNSEPGAYYFEYLLMNTLNKIVEWKNREYQKEQKAVKKPATRKRKKK